MMINSVYNYYAAQYGHREYSKYDTHSKAQLKSTFGRLQKSTVRLLLIRLIFLTRH